MAQVGTLIISDKVSKRKSSCEYSLKEDEEEEVELPIGRR